MGDIIYRPLIEGSTWSYTKLKTFSDCPYRWYLKYILKKKEEDQFYSSYGSFVHKIIEKYYRGEILQEDMLLHFVTNFQKEVKGERPKQSTVEKYIAAGAEYFRSFRPFSYSMVGVEYKVNFDLAGNRFIGFIDYLGEKDGDLYLIDNKSRELTPRSVCKQLKKDEELDSMLRQLYLYSIPIKEKLGRYPKYLCFNCFKNGVFIKEPFEEARLQEAKDWALSTIENILSCESFLPKEDFFSCKWICGLSGQCKYQSEDGDDY